MSEAMKGTVEAMPAVAGTLPVVQSLAGGVKRPVTLDKSLTKENYAADAKAAGDAIRSLSVTPQMYGAAADGVTDDTAAVRAAIASGSAVYFPKGTYLITETITINGGVRLYGAGITVATIKYTGSGYLFHIKAEYKNHPIIEKMNFVGTTTNSFIRCVSNDGNWGGCFTLRDFHVQYFNSEWMRLVSAFHVLIENGSFKTLGKCVMTTYDEIPTKTNFNNCITFRNCLISCPKYGEGDIPVMFEMFNVKHILFEQCALERCEVMFKDFITDKWRNSAEYSADTTIVNSLVLNECWLEGVGAVYDFTYRSGVPNTANCKYVDADWYAAKTAVNEPNHMHGTEDIWFKNGETSSMEAAIWGTEKVITQSVIKNNYDTQVSEFKQHKISTKEVIHKVPINTVVNKSSDGLTVAYDVRQISIYSRVSCRFKQNILFAYPDGTINIWEAEWFSYDKSYYLIKLPVRVYTYGSGTSTTAVETVVKESSGKLRATTDSATECLAIVTEYNFNAIKK